MNLILSQSHKIARKQELQGLSFFRSSESDEIGMLLTFTTRCYFPTYLYVVGRKLPITRKKGASGIILKSTSWVQN